MRLVARIFLPMIALAIVLTGCHRPAPIAYEPELTMHALVADIESPDNAYRLLAPAQSYGRFPCALAVAKLAVPTNAAGSQLTVAPMTPASQAFWAQTFRGLSAIRDLRFLSPLSLKPYGDGIDGLLEAAHDTEAPLLLVHVANRFGPNRAQVLGILYDVEARTPLAALHASASYLDEDGEEAAPEPQAGDHRASDAAYQAARTFEQRALACLREQAHADTPAPATPDDRWTPLYPYCWQPRVRPNLSPVTPESRPIGLTPAP